jgi:hypothetical protein
MMTNISIQTTQLKIQVKALKWYVTFFVIIQQTLAVHRGYFLKTIPHTMKSQHVNLCSCEKTCTSETKNT